MRRRADRRRAIVSGCVVAALACLVAASVRAGTAVDSALIGGTKKADTLVGTARADRMLGYSGNDWLRGMGGNDILDGGHGKDIVSGGPGDDRIFARDGSRDRIYCGVGNDRVTADTLDRIQGDCETKLLPEDEFPPLPPPSGMSVMQVDRGWTCTGPVDLDVVKITMTAAATDAQDAVHFRQGCSGLIRRIEIETWIGDGVKVNAPAPVAHDLLIGGGYIRCFDHVPGAHQDGIQALGGERITFRNVEINCNSTVNAQFFVAGDSNVFPTDVVCDRCFLGSGAASTYAVGASVRSGVRNSLVCRGRFRNSNITAAATDPIDVGNTILPATDPRC